MSTIILLVSMASSWPKVVAWLRGKGTFSADFVQPWIEGSLGKGRPTWRALVGLSNSISSGILQVRQEGGNTGTSKGLDFRRGEVFKRVVL